MKTLQISARKFDRASRQEAQAASLSEKACISVGIVAIVVMFISMGLMCVPAIVASGLTTLLAVFSAPSIREKGGES